MDPSFVRRPGAVVTRRRFLASLGVLAGAALVPFATRSRAALGRYEVGRPLLGTWVRVVARDGEPDRAARGIERAFAAVREVDAQMSVHREDSDLQRVNRAAGLAAVPAPPALIEVVARACEVSRRSGGIYDPTVLPLMRLYGFYGTVPDRMPDARRVDAALALMGCDQVTIDRAAGTLGLARRGAGLDLGSIGKGWAVDRALAALREQGVRHALVDAGGNVGAIGTSDDHEPGWSIGLLHPVTGRAEHTFTLRDAAIATSGNSEQWRMLGSIRCGHLFDARRGAPANGHLSVTVMARNGTDSDALSTTAFVLGPERVAAWPEALGVRALG